MGLHIHYRLGYFLATPITIFSIYLAVTHYMLVGPLLLIAFAVRAVQVHFQRSIKAIQKQGSWSKSFKMPQPEARTLVTRDGVSLRYYVLPATKKPEKFVIIAPGLGCASTFRLWATPLIHRLGRDNYTFLYWDYRGLFGSDNPKRIRRMSIHEHTEDLNELITAEKISVIHLLIGHSLGVQVSLEFAAVFPEKVEKMVLINGGHGKLLSSGLQPLFRVPFAGSVIYHCIRAFKDFVLNLSDDQLIAFNNWHVNVMIRRFLRMCVNFYSLLFGSRLVRDVLGPFYLEDFFEEFLLMGSSSTRHLVNYVRLIMELDAHSVYHLLPEINHPILIYSGLWDPLTPAYHSFEMAELLPNARHVMTFFSGHVSLLEEPGKVLREIDLFMQHRLPLKFLRKNSTIFQ